MGRITRLIKASKLAFFAMSNVEIVDAAEQFIFPLYETVDHPSIENVGHFLPGDAGTS